MRALAAGVLFAMTGSSALGQGPEGGFAHSPLVTPPGAVADAALGVAEPGVLPRLVRPPWWAPLASAAVPGGGQAALGQRRWLPYVALEVWAWLQYIDVRREGGRRRREYQLLARNVARYRFPGPYPVGDFEYYEHMLKNPESGDFDLFPGGDIDPETDTTTYNGRRWLDARRLFWENPDNAPPPGSPAYASALAFYEKNAIRTEYRWSWHLAKV